MSTDKTGGSAFPQNISFSGDGSGFVSSDELGCGGMTLRDYFAAKAMQGFLSNAHLAKHEPMDRVEMSNQSYMLADAMLAERAK